MEEMRGGRLLLYASVERNVYEYTVCCPGVVLGGGAVTSPLREEHRRLSGTSGSYVFAA